MSHMQTDSQLPYRLSGVADRFRAALTVETPEEGIELVHLTITADRPDIPPPLKLSWTHPVIDIQGVWHPNAYRNRGLAPDWFPGWRSNAASSAPVVCLFGGDSRSRLTFAFSDTLNPVVCQAGVHEETAELHCSVSLFEEPGAPLDRYEATLRVDRRELACFDSLDGVRRWWSGLPGLAPAPVPAAAREPMYSTWYSLHQYLSPEEIEAECRLAAELGCGAVIADDGWQTANNERGYAYCGDWEACADKMPDMAAHVERVHALGMKYMLWYSIPHIRPLPRLRADVWHSIPHIRPLPRLRADVWYSIPHIRPLPRPRADVWHSIPHIRPLPRLRADVWYSIPHIRPLPRLRADVWYSIPHIRPFPRLRADVWHSIPHIRPLPRLRADVWHSIPHIRPLPRLRADVWHSIPHIRPLPRLRADVWYSIPHIRPLPRPRADVWHSIPHIRPLPRLRADVWYSIPHIRLLPRLRVDVWYAVPYVGRHSRAWERFCGRMLYTIEERGWGVVDPRFPEVREYLIGIYTSAQRAWKLDGFKLDFIDSINPPAGNRLEFGGGRDCDAVPEAVDRLMSDIIARLSAVDPDVLIEFRQAYVGPYMRKYGNMFRAADCPNDAVENRVRTLDIRLLCGETAAHADMLMWHPDEPAESAALQLINVLFAVPQISLRLDRLPPAHLETVAHGLAFWKEHRDTLLDGRLEPYHPELLYPYVLAADTAKLIAAVYQPHTILPLRRELPDTVILVNGTREDGVHMELTKEAGEWEAHIRDCRGRTTARLALSLRAGVHPLPVPPAGTAELNRQ
ncbi:alpha-amylase family protein [Cohnella fermenti]|uniref:Alpha-galactosidase n=1 Tax=Cohnella fermenti TaxID=2565925 RepID=A0A4S4C5Y7_9BACL|nr:alpha-galactosidase [Cohnella fermenti]THF83261.1 alpha-galactosidase [Cohnella fermenti]